jgi:sugar phosphate isomerase/epimerase
MKRSIPFFLALAASISIAAEIPLPTWKHLSSRTGDLPRPNGGIQQTTGITFDIDGDGASDLVMGERTQAPGLVWMRRTATGWDKYAIDDGPRRPEAGGVPCDVDRDGDLDLIVVGDGQSNEMWWYENPHPSHDPAVSWTRRVIKQGGGTAHHDQAVADFKGTGRLQLMFWNQGAKKLLMAEFPENPREAGLWPITEIFDYANTPGMPTEINAKGQAVPIKQEGMAVSDIDGDGKPDLVAGMFWFKHVQGNEFKAVQYAPHPGRVAAGWFKPGKLPQIVLASGDGDAPLSLFECTGDPADPKSWQGRDLLGTKMIHGHSLDLGDINADGHLDIFTAEMGHWTNKPGSPPDDPNCRAWILYGDGQGSFTTTILSTGIGYHEARVADLDGDGDLDIYNKPYRFDTPRVDVWLNNSTRSGARGVGASASFPGPVGLQLWSLRAMAKENTPLALQTARGLGFTEVEVAGMPASLPPAQLRQMLLANGLKPVSGNWSYGDGEKNIAKVVAEAKALGVKYAGVGRIPQPNNRAFTEADALACAEIFNRAGAALAQEGIRFFYHNHGDEFQPHGKGRTLFDLMVDQTDPKLVCLELDIFWAFHAGQDPVKLMQKHPGRWHLMHVKDMRPGTETGGFSGKTDRNNDVAVGTGMIDVPAALCEAVKQGVKHYFIEDESSAPVQQIPQSLRYLESLSW